MSEPISVKILQFHSIRDRITRGHRPAYEEICVGCVCYGVMNSGVTVLVFCYSRCRGRLRGWRRSFRQCNRNGARHCSCRRGRKETGAGSIYCRFCYATNWGVRCCSGVYLVRCIWIFHGRSLILTASRNLSACVRLDALGYRRREIVVRVGRLATINNDRGLHK